MAIKKLLLHKDNKEKRLKFLKELIKWQHNQWDKVVFTEKSKFQLFCLNKHQYEAKKKRSINGTLPNIDS